MEKFKSFEHFKIWFAEKNTLNLRYIFCYILEKAIKI